MSPSRWPPKAGPPRPSNGMRAKSKRGDIGASWWSRRFIDALESLNLGGRLQRGRTYARKGQVLDLDIAPGWVTARVQGTRARPYRVRIGLAAFDDFRWQAIEERLSAAAKYSAKLLAGELPEDVEEAFHAEGVDLLPTKASDVTFDCSCPDWSVPCKHSAACLYLLAEQFDEDPFLILQWRGRERETLLGNLRQFRQNEQPGGPGTTAPLSLFRRIDQPDLSAFHSAGPGVLQPVGRPTRPTTSTPDFTGLSQPLADKLSGLYVQMQEGAAQLLAGGGDDEGEGPAGR